MALNLKQIQKKKTKVILNYCYNFAAFFEVGDMHSQKSTYLTVIEVINTKK